MLGLMGLLVPVIRELPEMLYEREKPFVVDSSLFESTFGISPTAMNDAIDATVSWYADKQPVHAR